VAAFWWTNVNTTQGAVNGGLGAMALLTVGLLP